MYLQLKYKNYIETSLLELKELIVSFMKLTNNTLYNLQKADDMIIFDTKSSSTLSELCRGYWVISI